MESAASDSEFCFYLSLSPDAPVPDDPMKSFLPSGLAAFHKDPVAIHALKFKKNSEFEAAELHILDSEFWILYSS